MAFRGKKVADIYVELNLDKDELRRGMASAGAEMGADADRVGRQLGDRMTAGIAQKVEALSAKVVKSRQAEAKAADAVQLAEVRLSEARDKGGQKASTLLALEQKLSQAQLKLADSSRAASVATAQHEDAQRRLGQAMADDIENIGKKIGPSSQNAGDDAGGKLALGMRMAFLRNSPLIVAAVGGALAAGAPLMIAAAVGLFAGIGIVAAAQSDKVKQAWTGTWTQIKTETIADAGVIEPVLTRVAGNVGAAFERMRPQIAGAFSAAAPQIEVFAGGVLKLAENALPGLVRAVEAGMPVTRGLADLLAKTGTGLSQFFDHINTHGPAAGAVFSQLGTTMGTLLPMLGELVGQGVELGATVLPMLNGGLSLVLGVVEHLDGVLPVLVGYFGAMKIINTVGGWATSAGAALSKLGAQDIPLVSAAAGKMGGALSGAGAVAAAGGVVTGALAVTLGLLLAAHQASEQRIRSWTQALNDGGAAAVAARGEMAAHDDQIRKATTGLSGFITSMSMAAPALNDMKGETNAARDANNAYLASLTPVEAAQRNLKIAEDAVSQAIKDHGSTSGDVMVATQRYKDAQRDLEVQEGKVQAAIHGVTQAMLDQENQARGSIDASFAYQDAQAQLKDKQQAVIDAQNHLNDSNKATRTSTDDVANAQRAYAEGIWDTAQKAAAASPMLDGLKQGTSEYDRAVQNLTLKSLVDMRAGLGPQMQATVDGMIAKLQAGGASLDELGAKKPTPTVSLAMDPFTAAFNGVMGNVATMTGQRPTPVAELNKGPFDAGFFAALGNIATLGAQRPTPTAQIYSGPFDAVYGSLMGRLGTIDGQRPNPVAFLSANTSAAEAALNYAARNRTAVITTLYNTSAARGMATGGPVTYAASGKIVGPGTGTSDSVPAIGPGGARWALSNGEWVIREAVSRAQGNAKMAALNAGRATIVPTVARRPMVGAGARSSAAGASAAGSAGAGQVVHIDNLTVQVQTPLNLMNPQDLRKAGLIIRDEIRRVEREQS